MAVHPIFRVRRRVLAEILVGGGTVEAWRYRAAALEPFEDYADLAALLLPGPSQPGTPAGASPSGSAPPEKTNKKERHPAF